ncbi:uncharacterized protein METZ01_LOCUS273266, partial [marine metagenome]
EYRVMGAPDVVRLQDSVKVDYRDSSRRSLPGQRSNPPKP